MEQSIYTYCFKDYDSGNRGWGFYSFSDGMAAYFHRAPELQTMADGRNYCVPSNSEVWKVNPITDYDRDIVQEAQSIAQYHPQRFSYQKLEISHEETAVFVFGKNLGREIVSEGRAGNKLVYTLVGSMREVLDYPCFYGDNAFFQNKLTRSYFVNGNRDSRAAALPPVSLIAGKRVTRESAHAFLQADPNRTEYLASLFYALLQERSGGNRPILICDQKENIIFWIAAVTLLFPLEIAKNISFNTYDGLGETSVPQIPTQMALCGVYSPTVNGAPESHATNYDAGAFQNRKDVVLFDLECLLLPTIKTDAFLPVIRAFCQGDEKPLQEYHQYLMHNTTYRDYGTEYTAFYPVGTERAALFPYYSREVQEKMLHAVYPSKLFSASLSDVELQDATVVLRSSLKNGLLSREQLLNEIWRYAANALKDAEDDFQHLIRLEAVCQLVGYSTETIIRMYFCQKPKQWCEYFASMKKCSENKLILLLKLLDLSRPEEQEAFQILARLLSESENGNAKVKQFLSRQLERLFGVAQPTVSPQMALDLLSVSDCATVFSQHLAKLYMQWNPNYQEQAFSILESAYLGDAFVHALQEMIWSQPDAFQRAYQTIEMMQRHGSRFTASWEERFHQNLSQTPLQHQFEWTILLLQNGAWGYSLKFSEFVENLLLQVPFHSAEELAGFSLLLCCRIASLGGTQYSIFLIYGAVKRSGIKFKSWKRAVEIVSCAEFPPELVQCMREMLVNAVQRFFDEEKGAGHEPSEETRSVLKKFKFFGRK